VVEKVRIEIPTLQALEKPWYFHAHFFDPHGPYSPPPSYYDLSGVPPIGFDLSIESQMDQAVLAYPLMPEWWQQAFLEQTSVLYEAELRFWDDNLAMLWGHLAVAELLDDTLVLFWTDHGEQFMERGRTGHGEELYAEENGSVAFFWSKNLEPQVWTETTMHMDLTATLFDLYGVTPPIPADGFAVGTAPADRVLQTANYILNREVTLAVTKNHHSLIYRWDGARSLYDDKLDAKQLDDLYSPTHPKAIELWDDLLPLTQQVETLWPHLGPPVRPGP
jgi:arylsulfatase A-like enzyme